MCRDAGIAMIWARSSALLDAVMPVCRVRSARALGYSNVIAADLERRLTAEGSDLFLGCCMCDAQTFLHPEDDGASSRIRRE